MNDDIAALKTRLERLTQKASTSPSSKRFGPDSMSPGKENAEMLRLKARAEILAKKIDSTSRHMATMAAATGSPKAAAEFVKTEMLARSPSSASSSRAAHSWKNSPSKARDLGQVWMCALFIWLQLRCVHILRSMLLYTLTSMLYEGRIRCHICSREKLCRAHQRT